MTLRPAQDVAGPPTGSPTHRGPIGRTGQALPRLSPRDLYRLRRARLVAEGAMLKARMARHFLDAVTLELERRYGLLGLEATVDPTTGTIAQDGARNEAGESPSLNPKRCPQPAEGR